MNTDHRTTLGDAPGGGHVVTGAASQRIGLIEHEAERGLAACSQEDRVAEGGDLGQVADEHEVLFRRLAEAETGVGPKLFRRHAGGFRRA